MQLIPQLQALLAQQKLPGWTAHQTMINQRYQSQDRQSTALNPPANHRQASVLVLLYPKTQIWHTALMQRPDTARTHTRQVSFPGGKAENFDPSPMHTALRETQEEFGINVPSEQVLAPLSPLYIPPSRMYVRPYLAYLDHYPQFQPDQGEVSQILETPLFWLLENHRRKIGPVRIYPENIEIDNIPFFDFHNRPVWGATAMMLSEVAALLQQLPQNLIQTEVFP